MSEESGELYRRMFDRLLWEYAHRPDCYYCPFGQFCPQWKAGKKPDASDCMDYVDEEYERVKRMLDDALVAEV